MKGQLGFLSIPSSYLTPLSNIPRSSHPLRSRNPNIMSFEIKPAQFSDAAAIAKVIVRAFATNPIHALKWAGVTPGALEAWERKTIERSFVLLPNTRYYKALEAESGSVSSVPRFSNSAVDVMWQPLIEEVLQERRRLLVLAPPRPGTLGSAAAYLYDGISAGRL